MITKSTTVKNVACAVRLAGSLFLFQPAMANDSLPAKVIAPQQDPQVFGARGIYVYAEQPQSSPTQFDQALGIPGIDGMAMVLDWSNIEPSKGNYDYSTLDWQLQEAQKYNLPIELVIRAGKSVPSWLLGASALHLAYAPHAGKGQCYPVNIPPPWEKGFQTEFADMLSHAANHLQKKGAKIAVVKLTGLNSTTEELRLPAEDQQETSGCPSGGIDDVAAWQNANCTPTLLQQAFVQLTDTFGKTFQTTPITLAIIPQGGFPPIKDRQSPPLRGKKKKQLNDQVLSSLVGSAASALSGRFILQFDYLMYNQPANTETISLARSNNLPVAWQTNLWLGNQGMGAACDGSVGGGTPCTDAQYLALLEEGIHPAGGSGLSAQGLYIEVFPYDAINHCLSIGKAHVELTGDTQLVGTCPTPAQILPPTVPKCIPGIKCAKPN